MDGFAQTRGSDDLFDDDFTPLPAPQPEPYEPQHVQSTSAHAQQPGRYENPPPAPDDVQLPQPGSIPVPSDPEPPSRDSIPIPQQPPTQPRPRSPVRGDRHLTGGVAKPKLTGEELSAKLAAAKLNSAKRAEAHRVAEADEADFHAREAKVQIKRQEEGKARRLMDTERERNRLRKMGAKGGREWDEGKEEQAQNDRRGGSRKRINGGIGPRGGSDRLYQDGLPERGQQAHRAGYEPRGRGRGRGRGGSGRGAFQLSLQGKKEQRLPDPEQDFPALPAAKGTSESRPLPPNKAAAPSQVTLEESSWADQVTEAQNP